MVTVPTHFRFVFRGVFLGTPEIWSFGFHMRRDIAAGPDVTLSDIHADQVTTAAATFFGAGIMDAGVSLVDWRAYQIGTNNKMEGNGPLLTIVDPGTIHGSGGKIYPPQVALVVTTVAANRGPAKRGRFYLPGPAMTIGNDRRLDDSQCGIVESVTKQFLKDVSDAIDIPLSLSGSEGVNISSSPAGVGTRQTIDHLEVGHVLDTMTSRRNQLDEHRLVGANIDW